MYKLQPAPERRYVFSPSTKIAAGARDLSRRNVRTAQTRPQNSKASFAHQHPCGLKSALRPSRGDDAAKAVLLKFRHDRVIGIAAGDNRPGLRVELQQSFDRFLAAHAPGDRQVHDHRAERLARLGGFAITPERLDAIARQFRVVAEALEHDV